MLRRAVHGILVLALVGVAAAAEPEPVVLLDFETGEPMDGWRIDGTGVSEIRVPDGATPSGGRALKLIEKDGKGSIHRPLANAGADWRTARAFSLHAAVESEDAIELRLLAHGPRGREAMLKRFTVEPGPWREVVLPLEEWRENVCDQVCGFGALVGLELRWDGGTGSVSIDDLRLLPGDRGTKSCRAAPETWLQQAFPEGNARTYESAHFRLFTDAPDIAPAEAKQLLGRMEAAYELLKTTYRLPGEPVARAPLFVFATRDRYRAFFERVGKRYRVNISAPKSSGYSCLGVAASFYAPKYDWDRPTFVHEATHSVVRRLLHVPSNGNWIQEALANAVQLRLYPDAIDPALVHKHARRLEAGEEGFFLPLEELLEKRSVSTKNYAQLATFMDFLATVHPEALATFWGRVLAFEKRIGDAGLPALLSVLEDTAESLQADYAAWAQTWPP